MISTKNAINIALKILGIAGLTATVVVAPNAIQGLDILLRKSEARTFNKRRLLNELRRQGLVIDTQVGNEIHFNLNPAGAKRLQQIIVTETDIPRPGKWDKKWRLVSFDVPVRYSKERKYFTEKLRDLNFFMLHKSLWIFPYPCFVQIEQLAGYYNVLRYCRFMEVSKVDEIAASRLLRYFKLG